ncbi:MAG: HAD-IA family hydrolase [Pseudomonadota bacterium]
MIVYKPVSDIRAMSFDLDDTLYNNMPYIMLAEQYLLTYIAEYYPQAAHISKNEWQQFKNAALEEAPTLKHDMGMLRTVTLTKGFIYAGFNSDEIPDAVSDCYDVFYQQRSNFTVDEKTSKVLSYLSRKLPLVAITNGNVDCEKIGIDKYFTHVLHAGKDGRMKPSSDMFNKACMLLDIPPENMLHIGDSLEKDVKGSLDAGYKSAWFAVNRPMLIKNEMSPVLPHLQLESLDELKLIAKNFN